MTPEQAAAMAEQMGKLGDISESQLKWVSRCARVCAVGISLELNCSVYISPPRHLSAIM
jgi:hypothetical protein